MVDAGLTHEFAMQLRDLRVRYQRLAKSPHIARVGNVRTRCCDCSSRVLLVLDDTRSVLARYDVHKKNGTLSSSESTKMKALSSRSQAFSGWKKKMCWTTQDVSPTTNSNSPLTEVGDYSRCR